MVKKSILIAFLFIICANIKAQDTTVTFTKAEFAKVKFIRQALKGLPRDCKILSYEISMYMVNGVKTKTYIAGQKEDYTKLYIEHATKNGGEMTIQNLKTTCSAASHKTKYKIVVN